MRASRPTRSSRPRRSSSPAAFRGTPRRSDADRRPGSPPRRPRGQRPAAAPEIPLLIGTNAQEGTFFFRAGGRRVDPGPEQLRAMVAHLAHVAPMRSRARSPRHATACRRRHRRPDANDVLCAVVTEAWFAGPVRRYAAARAAAGATVHRYRIEQPRRTRTTSARCTRSACRCCSAAGEGGVPRRLAGDSTGTAGVDRSHPDRRPPVRPQRAARLGAVTTEEVVYGGTDGARTVGR